MCTRQSPARFIFQAHLDLITGLISQSMMNLTGLTPPRDASRRKESIDGLFGVKVDHDASSPSTDHLDRCWSRRVDFKFYKYENTDLVYFKLCIYTSRNDISLYYDLNYSEDCLQAEL